MATVLIGFMGAGKSSAARALSDDCADTDALIEARAGKTVAEIFSSQGEEAFRAIEEEIVLETLTSGDVVALGGGAVTSTAVRDALAGHTVIWMDADDDVAWERATRKQSERPLAQDREAFDALHAERRPLYESVATAVIPPGSDLAAARAAWESMPGGTRMAWSPMGQYPVFAGRGIMGMQTGAEGPDSRRFVITDETVGDLYTDKITGAAGSIEFPAGEQHKTLQTAEIAWRALAEQGATRADMIVALGGGVVGDLAGFVAHGYQRGIPVVQVPTTVVAMVDSAIGGKTGVDLPDAKNYVGAYHQPAAVISDTTALATLPAAEYAAGYAEVVKTALIAGGTLWDRVAAGDAVDDDIIFDCARTKIGVVAADERDGGLRQILNLGHTVGHALETVTRYQRLRHGEAVALGLLVALRLSELAELRAQVSELLSAAGLPVTIDGIDADAVIAATTRDKKRTGAKVPFVLVRAPGDVVFGQPVGDAALRAAVAEILTA